MSIRDVAPVHVGDVQYAHVGEAGIAYRIVSSGAVDPLEIVLVLSAALTMDALLEEPSGRRLVAALAHIGRVVLYDRRGVGLSDPLSGPDERTRAAWAHDLEAVIGAAEMKRPAIVVLNGSDPVVLYASSHVDEVGPIVIYEPNLASLADSATRVETSRALQANVTGDFDLHRFVCPTRADDPTFRAWFERAGRVAAGPAAARRLYETATPEEVVALREAHAKLAGDVLCLRRPARTLWSADAVRSAFPNATIIDLPGRDHYPLGERLDALLAETTRFLTGTPHTGPHARTVAALVFTDIVGSTAHAATIGDAEWKTTIGHHDALATTTIERHGGRVIKSTGDGLFAQVPSVGDALMASTEIRDVLLSQGIRIRVGIHVADVEARDDDLTGLGVHYAARVMAAAEPNEILLSPSAALAALGASGSFDEQGPYSLKGFDPPQILTRYEPQSPGLPRRERE